jgi:hypothetical protein
MCGSYARAGNIVELTNAYVRLRHESTGMILGAFDGRIRLGETTEPRTFQVPDGQQELHVTLNWPGSALDLLLTDPTGKIVDAAYAGAQVFRDRLPVYVIVRDPRPGTWQFRVRGVDVPSLGTVYSVVASVRALPPGLSATGGLGLAGLILLVGLMVSVALLGWVAARHQRSGGGRPLGYLDPKRVPGGPPSAHIPITRLPFTIGRDASCQLVLADAGVSRYHARIVRVGQGLVIEDLGSHNGIFVNRRRVARARLDPATEIRLGRTELQFVPPQQQAAPPHRLQAPGRVR